MTAKHNVSIVISVTSKTGKQQHQSTISHNSPRHEVGTLLCVKSIWPLSHTSRLISTFILSIAIDIVVKGWARLFRTRKNAPHLEKKERKKFHRRKKATRRSSPGQPQAQPTAIVELPEFSSRDRSPVRPTNENGRQVLSCSFGGGISGTAVKLRRHYKVFHVSSNVA